MYVFLEPINCFLSFLLWLDLLIAWKPAKHLKFITSKTIIIKGLWPTFLEKYSHVNTIIPHGWIIDCVFTRINQWGNPQTKIFYNIKLWQLAHQLTHQFNTVYHKKFLIDVWFMKALTEFHILLLQNFSVFLSSYDNLVYFKLWS